MNDTITELEGRFHDALVDAYAGLWTKAAPELRDLWETSANWIASLPEASLSEENRLAHFELSSALFECSMATGDHQSAWAVAKALHDLSGNDHPYKIRSIIFMARTLIQRQEWEKARTYLSHAGKRLEKSEHDEEQALFYLHGAELLSEMKKTDMAVESYSRALDYASRSEGEDAAGIQAQCCLRLAREMVEAGDLDQAVDWAKKGSVAALDSSRHAFRRSGPVRGLKILCVGRDEFLPHKALRPALDSHVPVYLEMAGLFNLLGRWEYCDRTYEGLENRLKECGDEQHKGRLWAFLGKGEIALKQRRYDDAKRFLQKAGDPEMPDAGGRLLHSQYYLNLIAAMSDPDPTRDSMAFERMLKRLDEVEDTETRGELQIRIRQQIAYSRHLKGDYESAVRLLNASIDEAPEEASPCLLGESQRLLGVVLTAAGKFRESEHALKRALKIFQANKCPYETASACQALGMNFLAMGDPDKASFFLNQGTEIMEKLDVDSELAKCYNARGRAFLMEENFESADECFQKEMKLVKTRSNPLELAWAHFHLGRMFRLIGRIYLAEENLTRAGGLFHKVGREEMEAEVLLEMALVKSGQKDFKQAIDLGFKARDLLDKGVSLSARARAYNTLGIIQRDARKYQVARRSFEECIRLAEKISEVNIILAEACYECALLSQALRDKTAAVALMSRAIEISEKLGLKKRLARYMDALREISPDAVGQLHFRRIGGKGALVHLDRGKFGRTEATRRAVSILFCDIRGFTSASERLSLEEVASLLNDFYEIVSKTVMKNHGLVNKFIGDAALSVFNIDGSLQSHTLWASRAAFELVEAIEASNMVRRQKGQFELSIGAGLNCGEAIVGSFGSSLGEDYTVIGDVVNTASRIQGLAQAGQIVASPAVMEAVEEFFEFEDYGSHQLKGKEEPVNLWKIVGSKSAFEELRAADGSSGH